ncbi:ankyrin repeat domain-containing protein [Holosporaceae bacterium 'Namur']|nr:ankyrin repeat domain-containing protein [Holosporaceae bacterium 'Namur']
MKNEIHQSMKDSSIKNALNILNNTRNVYSIINSKDEHGMTPLHIFALYHCFLKIEELEVANLLLEKGSDINAVDNIGCTSLHFGVTKFTNMLDLARQALIDNKFQNPELIVLQRCAPFLGWLIDNGARTDIRSKQNVAALEVLNYYLPENAKVNEEYLVDAYKNWAKNNIMQQQADTQESKNLPKYVYDNHQNSHAKRLQNRESQEEKKGCCIMM